MLIIAHRGNTTGPNRADENKPEYLEKALSAGYQVEVDVWHTPDGLFIGHDIPSFKIEINKFEDERYWCHAKNVEALKIMLDNGNIHCFYHKSDDVTLTSKGIIWTFPGKTLVPGSVCVLPEVRVNGRLNECFGICTDYADRFNNLFN